MLVVTVDDDAPRLSSTEVRKLITLMELPFVVPFEDRVKVSVASCLCVEIFSVDATGPAGTACTWH